MTPFQERFFRNAIVNNYWAGSIGRSSGKTIHGARKWLWHSQGYRKRRFWWV